jgi:hypothetical protein
MIQKNRMPKQATAKIDFDLKEYITNAKAAVAAANKNKWDFFLPEEKKQPAKHIKKAIIQSCIPGAINRSVSPWAARYSIRSSGSILETVDTMK